MYYCGCRDVVGLLEHGDLALAALAAGVGGQPGGSAGDAPPFSLPGDAPHYAPDRPADVRHVELDVTLDFERKAMRGVVTTTFAALFEQIREVTLNATELQIERVTLVAADGAEGAPLDYWTDAETLHIRLDRSYRYGEEVAVRVAYAAEPRIGLVFVGPTEGDPQLPVQAWTQGETQYIRYFFPSHDFPHERATMALRATVPARFFALSNGRLEATRDNPDGTKTYAWRQEVAFPAYLVTLVVGEFAEIHDTWRETPVNYYVPVGREEDGRRMMGRTPQMIAFYTRRFGLDYPYVKYAQVIAQMFLGAMENVSATTHTYRLLGDARAYLDWTPEPTVSHELVHQWFGDLITIRDWSQTWLKESFATYFSSAWTEESRGVDEFRVELRADLRAYLAADALGRRPIVYNIYRKNGHEIFDRHVYQKGGLVLHMLRNILGEDAFWRGIQRYAARNQGREVITADFERALEEATGRSLAQFFEQWVYKAGHPAFQVSYNWDDERSQARVTVAQTQPVDATTPLFVTPVDIAFFVPDREGLRPTDPDAPATLVTFRAQIEEARQTFTFPLPRRPWSVRFDQGGWLLKTLEFERPAELLRYQLRHDPDILGRIEAAEALGKLGDPASGEALAEALEAEPFWAVKGALAEALAGLRTARALDALLDELRRLDGARDADRLRARRALVTALGSFSAPAQAELAGRAAEALTRIVRAGDPSYFVEAAAATALGKTRAPGAFETLLAKLDTPSWLETIRGGVFAGLGELGEARSVEPLARWLDRAKPMDARAGATEGLRALAATKRVDDEAARTRAVEALIAALDDPWELVVRGAINALAAWGDRRAIPALERLSRQEWHDELLVIRPARVALQTLRRGATPGDETRALRDDLEQVREENRTLRERLDALASRLDASAPRQDVEPHV